MTTGRPMRAQELLGEDEWVRRLASRLVGDEHAAEDIAQEVRLAAWRRFGGLRRAELGGWIAGAVRNLARRHRRDEAARSHHEGAAARPPEERPDGAGLARLELQRLLAEAVLGLPEPLREAIVLRYLEECSYLTLASRLGLSEPAARKRVSRGLALLRERLPSDGPGGARWLSSLAFGLSLRGESEMAGTLSLGAFSMGTKSVAMAVGVAALLGVGALVLSQPNLPVGAALEPSDPPPEVSAETPRATPSAAPPVEAGAREVAIVPVGSADTSLAAVGIVASANRERDLHGRVLGPEGRPVAGARLEVRRVRFREYTTFAPESGSGTRPGEVQGHAVTDAAGEFAVPLAPGVPFDLWADAPGLSAATLTDRQAGECVELRLAKPATLSGTVRVEGSTTPIVGARVTGRLDDSSGLVLFRAETDEEGAFHSGDVAPGTLRLTLDAPGFEPVTEAVLVALREGQHARRDFDLLAGAVVRGVVLDGATGQGIAGARVHAEPGSRTAVETDAYGAYELRGLARDGTQGLSVTARGFGAASLRFPGSVGTKVEHDFVLLPGGTVRGRIVDEGGEAVSGAHVTALASAEGSSPGRLDRCQVTSDEDGEFVLRDLPREGEHVLLLLAEGLGTEVLELPAAGERPAVLDLGEIVLASGASIRGTVTDEHGNPMPDARLRLLGADPIHTDALREDGNRWSEDRVQVDQRTARTDDRGRFFFRDLAPGQYRLELSRHRRGTVTVTEEFDGTHLVNLAVEAGEVLEGVHLEIDLGKSLAGRFVDGVGRPVAGILVWIFPTEGEDGKKLNAVTGPDGRFDFLGLLGGSYRLSGYPTSIGLGLSESGAFLDVQRSGLRPGTRDLELVLEPAASTSGIVLLADGAPAVSAKVEAFDDAGEFLDLAYTEGDGRFQLNLPAGTRARVVAWPAPSDAPYWDNAASARIPAHRSTQRRGVAAGTSDLRLRLPGDE